MPRGAYIFSTLGPQLSEAEARFFAESDPWGFILFGRHAEDPVQMRRLTTDLRNAVGWNAPIFIDQEGGRVERMTAPHWRTWLPPLDDAARLGGNAARGLGLRYRIICEELRAVGIDGNCAPLADIALSTTHPVLRNRCYGTTAVGVSVRARTVAEAHLSSGILPVVKHMPGHGRATLDTHLELPRVSTALAGLQETDFAPFRALKNLPIGMTAHIVFEALDDLPATMSPNVIAYIRDVIGFTGLLMTDDISMQALTGTVAKRGRAALAAGCDLILHCNGDLAEMETLAALGPMTDAAHSRAEAALALRRPPESVDMAALEKDYAALGARPD